jgi:hypothetical protein
MEVKMIKAITLLLLSVFMGLISPAWASYISLNTIVTANVEKDVLKVSLKVTNQGDESAFNVQAEVRVEGKAVFARKETELGINQTYTADLTYDLKLDTPGIYPLVLVMHYTDANNYPFSALTARTFTYGSQEMPSELFGKISSKTFWKKGKINLTLKNVGKSAIEAKTYLVSPKEITVEDEFINVSLPPKGSKGVSFKVNNFSALSGSSYQIYAIAEYEKEGIHQTSVTPGIIKVKESRQILGLNYTTALIFMLVLGIIFVVVQFLMKK